MTIVLPVGDARRNEGPFATDLFQLKMALQLNYSHKMQTGETLRETIIL